MEQDQESGAGGQASEKAAASSANVKARFRLT